MPGPPLGPSYRITMTSPTVIFLPRIALIASCSNWKTRAGPAFRDLPPMPSILLGDLNEWRRRGRSGAPRARTDVCVSPPILSFPSCRPIFPLDRILGWPAGLILFRSRGSRHPTCAAIIRSSSANRQSELTVGNTGIAVCRLRQTRGLPTFLGLLLGAAGDANAVVCRAAVYHAGRAGAGAPLWCVGPMAPPPSPGLRGPRPSAIPMAPPRSRGLLALVSGAQASASAVNSAGPGRA